MEWYVSHLTVIMALRIVVPGYQIFTIKTLNRQKKLIPDSSGKEKLGSRERGFQ